MKRFFYIIVFIMVILSAGCRKNTEVVEPDTAIKSAQTQPVISLILPSNICSELTFTAKVKIDKPASGKVEILISADKGLTWKKAAETKDCKPENDLYITLKEGNYRLQAKYEGSGFSPVQSETVERSVSECLDCEEILIEPNLAGNNFLVKPGELRTFTAEYSVTACDQSYNELELHGGLIANAVYKSSYPEGAEVTYDGKNAVISWRIGDVQAGFENTYSVTFEYLIPDAPSGTHIPLTGGWIAGGKNAEGASVSTGDYNEIYIQVE